MNEIYKNIFVIFMILVTIACYSFAYHIKSIIGLIFYLSFSVIFLITRYYETVNYPKIIKMFLKILYISSLLFGIAFLLILIFNIPDSHLTGFTLVVIASLAITFFSFIALLKWKKYGITYLIEFNNTYIGSEFSVENIKHNKNLDDLVKKKK